MTDFDDRYRGTTFRRHDLRDVTFDDTYLTRARFKNVDLRGAVIRGSLLLDVEISGEISNLVVNGIDVTSFVESELNRLDPDRLKMRPRDVAGFREAWDTLERRWAETVERARRLEVLDPALLHERVDGDLVVHRDVEAPRVRHGRLAAAGRARRPQALEPARPAPRRHGGHPRGPPGPLRASVAR